MQIFEKILATESSDMQHTSRPSWTYFKNTVDLTFKNQHNSP